ncbi:hypothetical protein MNBD_ACTINO01-122 [hydrothermal vent metagenome]|uniref:Transcriptional regulator, TetR family n=1 Tax=hydrothermal vent metagenome TaxID=652676 RepID=A0A3B0RMM0_9ZZZZ
MGTKKNLIIRDDFDVQATAELLRQIPSERPITATRNALINVLEELYDAHNDRLFKRVGLMYNEPYVAAGSIAKGSAADQEERASAFHALSQPPLRDLESQVLAGVPMTALHIAVGEWQLRDGQTPFADLLAIAFDAAENL